MSILSFPLFGIYWQVPVGRATLGRIINVIGEPIDERGEISKLHVYTLAAGFTKIFLLPCCIILFFFTCASFV